MEISKWVYALVQYGIKKDLIEKEDKVYIRNAILEAIGCNEYEYQNQDIELQYPLHVILKNLTDYAISTGKCDGDDISSRDIFDTHIMGLLTDRPSKVNERFRNLYNDSPKAATDWFYRFSCDTNYIRLDRIAKDRKWTFDSEYGVLDITINLSKPEKDPKAIAAARNATASSYPVCQLCVENEGYGGRLDHPARQNHRIIPITINGNPWGFQYSPYVYYNEHCIVLNVHHTPMKIDEEAFKKLFSFVEQFPHYFIGSNADLPIVGGSILTHDHFQGGCYTFAMEKALVEKEFTLKDYKDVYVGIVKWPLSVIRLRSKDKERLIKLSTYILEKWRNYTDEEAFVFSNTKGEPHNTITPIVRMREDLFEIDLTLRNNITTEEHPLGIYHPHTQYHHIKKENIGLIEVMGLAVLPARLDREMNILANCLFNNDPMDTYEELQKHIEWVDSWKEKALGKSLEEITNLIESEIGKVYVKVLEDAGVYKCTKEGRKAFEKFINSL